LKGRKPLILVRAAILGLLLPATDHPDRDREVFLKLMLMDEDGRLKRRKRFDGKIVPRVMELLPEESWSQAIERTDRGFAWKRNIDPEVREAVEVDAFRHMSLDEQLRNCLRPEELPDSLLSDIWEKINEHLGTHARSLQDLVEELGVRRSGKTPRVGDPFCGGGSIPFEAARIGCDVYASDLNPIACLLTWGALNIIGGTEETRTEIVDTQKAVIRAVDEEITRLGIEHDGHAGDLRLLADAPGRWSHDYKVDRAGEVIEPMVPPYMATCPQTGWQVPMIETRQVSERHGVVLDLVPDPAARGYRIAARCGVDEETWTAFEAGTVIRAHGEFFLVHNPGGGEVRVRIANRAKAYLYCLEVEDPNTGWRVPLAPSWLISKNYRTIARLVPDPPAKRFSIAIEMGVDDDALERQPEAPSMATSISRLTDGGTPRRWSVSAARYASRVTIATPRKEPAIASDSIPAAIGIAKPRLTNYGLGRRKMLSLVLEIYFRSGSTRSSG
jgi:hypothetical protein